MSGKISKIFSISSASIVRISGDDGDIIVGPHCEEQINLTITLHSGALAEETSRMLEKNPWQLQVFQDGSWALDIER